MHLANYKAVNKVLCLFLNIRQAITFIWIDVYVYIHAYVFNSIGTITTETVLCAVLQEWSTAKEANLTE